MLLDSQARRVGYVRLSLTDRCNFRCSYCMPEEGVTLLPKDQQLTATEIAHLGRVLKSLGVTRVRLTGGEPTIRRDLVAIVAGLHALGLDELSMTTNGHYFAELAAPLAAAGLDRVTVSLDSLDATRFARITRRGDLARVLAGLDAATTNFVHTKLNCVVQGGSNDDELPAICEYAWARNVLPRFIEDMPMSGGTLYAGGRFVGAAAMRERLTAAFGALIPDTGGDVRGVGPARYYRTATGERFGIISAVTEPFCESCNRMRISSTGRLHACLGHDDEVNLLDQLRAGATDETIADLVRGALARKVSGHTFSSCGTGGPRRHMVTIGG